MIRWNDEKNKDLQRDRGISFEEIAEIIMHEEYIGKVEHLTITKQIIKYKIILNPIIWT